MPSEPGTVGTVHAIIVSRADALSPMRSMHSADGPMNTRSLSTHARANSAFSARKPYPGWMASAPVFFAAAMMFGMTR